MGRLKKAWEQTLGVLLHSIPGLYYYIALIRAFRGLEEVAIYYFDLKFIMRKREYRLNKY